MGEWSACMVVLIPPRVVKQRLRTFLTEEFTDEPGVRFEEVEGNLFGRRSINY